MTRSELNRLASQGEGLHLEFKRKLPLWPKLVREIVAFANTEGGILLIGVDDSGEIVGLKDPREIEEALEINLPLYMRPVPAFSISAIPLNRKRAVVALDIPCSTSKPHRALVSPEDTKGLALIRLADSSATASKEVFELLKYENRERNMRVEYGDKEKALMRYLEDHPSITLEAFQQIAGINRQAASRTLVHLVKANVLRIQPGIEKDLYFQML